MSTHHDGLIYTMVIMAAADSDMANSELRAIGEIVRHVPVFRDYNEEHLTNSAAQCAALLGQDDGLDKVLEFIKDALPEALYETSYALACNVVAADGEATQEELRLLEMIRHLLRIDRLIAAGIERGVRARHTTV